MYYMSKKSWPILYSKLLCKLGQDSSYRRPCSLLFLDIQYSKSCNIVTYMLWTGSWSIKAWCCCSYKHDSAGCGHRGRHGYWRWVIIYQSFNQTISYYYLQTSKTIFIVRPVESKGVGGRYLRYSLIHILRGGGIPPKSPLCTPLFIFKNFILSRVNRCSMLK